jgi:hypothetical protein
MYPRDGVETGDQRGHAGRLSQISILGDVVVVTIIQGCEDMEDESVFKALTALLGAVTSNNPLLACAQVDREGSTKGWWRRFCDWFLEGFSNTHTASDLSAPNVKKNIRLRISRSIGSTGFARLA